MVQWGNVKAGAPGRLHAAREAEFTVVEDFSTDQTQQDDGVDVSNASGEIGGASAPTQQQSKGRRFVEEKERQLTRNVIAITQDLISGNQQKNGASGDQIFLHYNERWVGFARSLESKWRQIEKDLGRFVNVHKQIDKLHPSRTSAAKILRMSKESHQTKHSKNCEFEFEHCWMLVKDKPKWANGWTTMKQPTQRRQRRRRS